MKPSRGRILGSHPTADFVCAAVVTPLSLDDCNSHSFRLYSMLLLAADVVWELGGVLTSYHTDTCGFLGNAIFALLVDMYIHRCPCSFRVCAFIWKTGPQRAQTLGRAPFFLESMTISAPLEPRSSLVLVRA